MERTLMLKDLLPYLIDDAVVDFIQIGIDGEDEWDTCIDIPASSSLLKTCYDWPVTCMGAELSNNADPFPVVRVMIRRPE